MSFRRLIDVQHMPDGTYRLHVLDWRWHHGAIGVGLVIGGVAAIVHDWKDRREWMPVRRLR